MSATPKRYRFDNEMPSYEPRPLPARRPETSVVQSPTQVRDQAFSWQHEEARQPQIIHVHQAPPDRTVQRLALGAGVGGGAVATAVYLGPLLVASLEAMAVIVLAGALAIAVLAWAIVHVVGGVKATEPTGRRNRRR